MNPLSKNSKIILSVTLLSAVLAAGCERRAAEQPPAATETPTTITPTPAPGTAGTTETPAAPTGAASGTTGMESGTAATTPSDTTGSTAAGTVGTAIDDTAITAKVKTALLADSDVKGLDISVETHDGNVMLSGFVNNQTQIDRALKLAGDVSGVKSVVNKMEVKKS
jgi:hyperosmotically inducible protein